MNDAQTGPSEECNFLPLAQIKLRSRRKRVRGRREGHVNRVGSSRYQSRLVHRRSKDRFAAIDGPGTTDNAITHGSEITAQSEPRSYNDAKIRFEAALG